MGTLYFEGVENVGSNKEIHITLVSGKEYQWAILFLIVLEEHFEVIFIEDNLLVDLPKHLIEKPCHHPYQFEIIVREHLIADVIRLFVD